jgi:signal transduction histidine kinase
VVTLTAVALAVTAFGLPLAVLISRNVASEERSEIERLALRAAVQASPEQLSGHRARLPSNPESEFVGLYDTAGRLVQGTGPPSLEPELSSVVHGSIDQFTSENALVVAVPLAARDHVYGEVRAAAPLKEVSHQVHRDWLILGLLGIAAVGIAGATAAVLSRRLAEPLETLERITTELGHGNLGARAPPSGVTEIDRAGQALNATAIRLGELIEREQAFSTQASHQLRTPLTGLRLTLEAGLQGDRSALERAARRAIDSADELERTIDDVLGLARRSIPQGPLLAIDAVLEDVRRRWIGLFTDQGRAIWTTANDPPPTRTPVAAIRQVLDVLIDNAYRHGRGSVSVRARASAGALAIDVTDEGRAPSLLPPGDGGLGLALANSIVVGQGGRLVQASGDETTRLTVLLPAEIL